MDELLPEVVQHPASHRTVRNICPQLRLSGPLRRHDPRLFDMAAEPVSRGGILTADRPGSVAYRACTSTSGCMCTESPCPCARKGAPHVVARVAVAPRPHERRCRSRVRGRGGSDPTLRVPGTARRRSGCARPSRPPVGSLPVHRSRAGRPTAGRVGRVPNACSAMPECRTASQSANGSAAASMRRSTPFLEGMLARSDLPWRNGMGVSMPILPDGTPRVQGGGSLRSQPYPLAYHERPGTHSATIRRPTTYETYEVSG